METKSPKASDVSKDKLSGLTKPSVTKVRDISTSIIPEDDSVLAL